MIQQRPAYEWHRDHHLRHSPRTTAEAIAQILASFQGTNRRECVRESEAHGQVIFGLAGLSLSVLSRARGSVFTRPLHYLRQSLRSRGAPHVMYNRCGAEPLMVWPLWVW
jgi:hypothetical protein